MQNLLHVVMIGLAATVMVTVVRELKPEWGTLLRLMVGALLFLVLLGPLSQVVAAISHMAQLAKIPGAYLGLLFKVLGIAYLTTLAARVAYDTGESAIGTRIELAGKIVILMLAVPLLKDITVELLKLIPS